MSWISTHSSFQEAPLLAVPLATWTQPTPLGQVVVAASPKGVALLSFNLHEAPDLLRRVAAGYRSARCLPLIEEREDPLVAHELRAYLEGDLMRFSVGVDLTSVRAPFHRRVLVALCGVGYGETTTCGRLARAVGRPGGARAVGQAVGTNPIAILVPCHRVLASDGSLGGYSAGLARKRALLAMEGRPEL